MESIVVLGGGLMGASVAWKLVERGAKVTLIEQQGDSYLNGSSYGTSRIARSLGPKKDVFSYAHKQTVKEVAKLIDFLNANEPKGDHSMEDIYSSSPVSYLYKRDQYDKIKKLRYKKQRSDYSRASANSSFRKFGMTIPNSTVMVREVRQYSGSLNPEALIKKLHIALKLKGGVIKYEHKVSKLVKIDGVFVMDVLNIKTNKTSKLKSEKVVVAAGPYTAAILKDYAPYLNRIIEPKKVALSFMKITDERYAELTEAEKAALKKGFPHFSQIGKEYFAMDMGAEDGASPVFKCGGHQRRRNVHNLDKVWSDVPPKKELKWIKKEFRKHLKMFEIQLLKKEIEIVKSYYCLYSESRSRNPLVTQIFNQYGTLDRNIAIISGMSGIGAKGCLCYGILGADLMLGKEGKPNKMYKRMLRTFSNPSVHLYPRRVRYGRLF